MFFCAVFPFLDWLINIKLVQYHKQWKKSHETYDCRALFAKDTSHSTVSQHAEKYKHSERKNGSVNWKKNKNQYLRQSKPYLRLITSETEE